MTVLSGLSLTACLCTVAAVRAADVIVVVSGTDGALPSVVAGLVETPVVNPHAPTPALLRCSTTPVPKHTCHKAAQCLPYMRLSQHHVVHLLPLQPSACAYRRTR